jgi:hypothetical protein
LEGLSNQIGECRSEVNRQVEKVQKLNEIIKNQEERQKENLNVENAKIVALETKVAELPRPAVEMEPSTATQISISPSVVHQSDHNIGVSPDENRVCSCQTNHEHVCMNNNHVDECRMHVIDNTQAFSFLSSTELPIPLFNEGKDNNPVYRLSRARLIELYDSWRILCLVPENENSRLSENFLER